jgi:hypothetical protein
MGAVAWIVGVVVRGETSRVLGTKSKCKSVLPHLLSTLNLYMIVVFTVYNPCNFDHRSRSSWEDIERCKTTPPHHTTPYHTTTQTGWRPRPLRRCAERPRLPGDATAGPRQRGVSPGGGGGGRRLPPRQIAFREGGGRRVSFPLSTSHNPTLATCCVCTNPHVHVCHGS